MFRKKFRVIGEVAVLAAALIAGSWASAPISAHSAEPLAPQIQQVGGPHVATPVKRADGTIALSCNGTVPPAAIPLPPVSHAQAAADMARLQGAAFAKAHSNFVLANPNDVVQTNLCSGGYAGNQPEN